MPPSLGTHVLVDLSGVEPARLDDAEAMGTLLARAATKGGATVVDRCLHRFAPQGVSGVVVLAESHVAVHTWPELGFASIDVFTCGLPAIAEAVADEVIAALQPESVERRTVARGVGVSTTSDETAA